MSLWKVRHNLSPFHEGMLVALAVAYGVFAIYLASVQPLVVALTSDIRTVPEPVSLDTDRWERATNVEARYVFGVPSGWVVEASSSERVALASSRRQLEDGSSKAIVIETRPIAERSEILNIAAEELDGTRPALYDVAVHGRPGLFAVQFEGSRVAHQTVYVKEGNLVHIFRTGDLDPAAFSTFISTVKFLPAPDAATGAETP